MTCVCTHGSAAHWEQVGSCGQCGHAMTVAMTPLGLKTDMPARCPKFTAAPVQEAKGCA